MKGKPLLPTLRQKKRYVFYDYISEKEIPKDKVFYAIVYAFKELFGKIDLSKANITKINLADINKKTNTQNLKYQEIFNKANVLRVNNKYLEHLRVAMAYINEIDGLKINIYTLFVSGIIKKAKSRYLKEFNLKNY